MPISPARRIAFEILRRVEAEGAYASDLLHAELSDKTKREDAALATELTMGVLRWRGLLDFLLERHLKGSSASLDPEVLLALRLGLYQLRFLTRVPPRAAVNESVELAKRAGKSSAAPLVNAVLRRAAAEANEPPDKYLPPGLSPAERLGTLQSHPTWIVERWLRRLGAGRTEGLLEANNRAPNLAIAVHDSSRNAEIEAMLRSVGMEVKPGRLLRTARIVEGGSPARAEPFRRGWISIQDEASQAIPLLLGVKPGDAVLDLCAAPGGKTSRLARMAAPGGSVIAGDIHPHRLRAMRMQLERLGVHNVKAVALDATTSLPFAKSFDRILIDAPCSGTGTLARHPEIRWRLVPAELGQFHRRQVMMLRAALEHLKPNGRLLYSTCSLEPEENEEVVREILDGASDLCLAPAETLERQMEMHWAAGVPREQLLDPSGMFRTFPPDHHTDGFFAVAFEKH
jgi:16S rRNA (cytosine967-C5)-methyltransferase